MADAPFDLVALLERDATSIVDEACGALSRSHLHHYDEIDPTERRRRVQALFDAVVASVRRRDLTVVQHYAESVAMDRFAGGFAIAEVQAAFNVLEEVLWRRVIAAAQPVQLAEAIGMVGTVLGAGKDSLARSYVSLASQRRVQSLDLTALFEGLGDP